MLVMLPSGRRSKVGGDMISEDQISGCKIRNIFFFLLYETIVAVKEEAEPKMKKEGA
jgi:hypothetical protein